jgi:uncharacterized protein
MTKILMAWAVILGVLVSPVVADQMTAAKRADIEKLMRIIGPPDVTKQTSHFFVRQFSQTIRASRPDLPAKTYQILSEEINRVIDEHMTAKGGFFDMAVPIYAKHFNHKEIKGLLNFYSTDLGKKTIRVWPLIFQESMVMAQDWGKSLVPLIKNKVNTRFKKEGIELII